MTPELEAALNKIGWAGIAERSKINSLRYERMLTLRGNQLFRSRIEADENLERLRCLRDSVMLTLGLLRELPEEHSYYLEQLADLHSKDPADSRDRIPPAINALDEIATAVNGLYQRARYEVDGQEKAIDKQNARVRNQTIRDEKRTGVKQGRPTERAAYDLAETVLEIYVIGTGRRPTAGQQSTHPYVNCEYGRSVAEVFAALGLSVRPYKYCKAARQKYSDEDIEMLQQVMRPEYRTCSSQL
tara:strand:- start:724 stop:1455 length:732 start_codon:yes stop_codon:yes gene_type:complete